MAYNLRYYVPWSSKQTRGYVYIYKIDSTDASQGLILMKDGIEINTTFNDWNEPIIQQNAQVTILNDRSDFFELLPLMTAEEREYKIKIVETNPSTHTYFEGYLNSDVVEQSYLKKKPIRLVASNYIGKLENVSPPCIEETAIGYNSLIDVISDTLKIIGGDSSIFVNISLCPSEAKTTFAVNNSVLNLCSIDNEVFWKNNEERDSGLDILTKILKPVDSYIYWYDGNYYIERYDDLWKYPQTYVRYRTDVSYGYTTVGTAINRTDVSRNIETPLHLNEEQVLTVTPGLNKIEINLNEEEYQSMVRNYWSPIKDTSIETALPQPWGSWLHWKEQIDEKDGVPVYSYYYDAGAYKTMLNSFKRVNAPTYEGPLGIQDPCTHGASSSFRMTVPEASLGATNLNISWKWAPSSSKTLTGKTFKLGYLLEIRYKDGVGGLYLKENDDGIWTTEDRLTGLNTITIDSSEMETPYVKELSISVPILDISTSSLSSLSGDYQMVFTITPTRDNRSSGWPISSQEYFGDVTVSVSQPNEDNLLIGTINNRFLNKKNISLDIFDATSFNIKNGIWTYAGTARRRTSGSWFDDTSTYHSLAEKLMVGKWKLYEKSRQTLCSTIYTTDYLKPLSAWYDSYQPTKNFVLVGYSFTPTKNQYDCVWNEFQNDTSVNLKYE